MILNFGYLQGMTFQDITYSKDFANNGRVSGIIGEQCQWFQLEENLSLTIVDYLESQGFIDIDTYIATIPDPVDQDGVFYIASEHEAQIRRRIKR